MQKPEVPIETNNMLHNAEALWGGMQEETREQIARWYNMCKIKSARQTSLKMQDLLKKEKRESCSFVSS